MDIQKFVKISASVTLLSLVMPMSVLALEGGRASPSRLATSGSPCEGKTAQDLYRCRRFEAQAFIRQVIMESNKENNEQVRTMRAMKNELNAEQRAFYRNPTTQAERDAFRTKMQSDRLKQYHDWRVQYEELRLARKNLRKQTRMPNNKELRMDMLSKRTDLRAAIRADKKTRRTVVQEKLDFIRSYAR